MTLSSLAQTPSGGKKKSVSSAANETVLIVMRTEPATPSVQRSYQLTALHITWWAHDRGVDQPTHSFILIISVWWTRPHLAGWLIPAFLESLGLWMGLYSRIGEQRAFGIHDLYRGYCCSVVTVFIAPGSVVCFILTWMAVPKLPMSWHFNPKVTGSIPPTDNQIPHLAATG